VILIVAIPEVLYDSVLNSEERLSQAGRGRL